MNKMHKQQQTNDRRLIDKSVMNLHEMSWYVCVCSALKRKWFSSTFPLTHTASGFCSFWLLCSSLVLIICCSVCKTLGGKTVCFNPLWLFPLWENEACDVHWAQERWTTNSRKWVSVTWLAGWLAGGTSIHPHTHTHTLQMQMRRGELWGEMWVTAQ